jgi:hypothetical protein
LGTVGASKKMTVGSQLSMAGTRVISGRSHLQTNT